MKLLFIAGYILCVFILIGLPAIRVYRQTGINPIRTKNQKSVHAYVTNLIRVLFLLPFISVVLFSVNPAWYRFLQPVAWLNYGFLKIAGGALMAVALGYIALAQYQMGTSWRVGIDDKNKTVLVARGLYSFSRNPIYLGIFVALAGLFIALPDILTFTTAVATFFVINIQVRLEEEFLLQQHGKAFEAYMAEVSRWL